MSFRQLQPRRLRLEWQRLHKKWTGKLLRRNDQVLTLAPPGEANGHALVSYVLDGVRQARAGKIEHGHTHFWEAHCVAQTFVDLGLEVDVVHWQNADFVPTKPYRIAVDVRSNLERWAPNLPQDCVKVFHGETAHWRYHRDAQAVRYADLRRRRGGELPPVKPAEPNRGIETADVGFILGNEFTLGTFAFAGTPLERLSISSNSAYPDLERGADAARRFLWLGSGDLVHKGLDLVLEAVAARPHLELVVCGPIHRERAFEKLYQHELYELPNVFTYGWIDTDSRDFLDIARRCSALIYPSCSEGQCGGVITCMHAGLVPMLTRQCGITLTPDRGDLLPDLLMPPPLANACEDPVAAIGDAMDRHAQRDLDTIGAMSRAATTYARTQHTRARFAQRYRALVAGALDLGEAQTNLEPPR